MLDRKTGKADVLARVEIASGANYPNKVTPIRGQRLLPLCRLVALERWMPQNCEQSMRAIEKNNSVATYNLLKRIAAEY
jgi:hypothetical protein